MTVSAPRPPLVVLDDDPTGTQAVADVPVLLAWDAELVREPVAAGARSIHLLTNSRAHPPAEAYAIARSAARAAADALPSLRLALRGDSTLRAHLLEEYRAVVDAAFPGRAPPLLLVPALPHAGRITLGGVHLLERNGTRTPLHETEYARDPNLGYRDARLLRWAEERSGGLFRAADGRELGLERVRSGGAPAVAEALAALAEAGRPAVCVPDAETVADLETIAAGLRLAEEGGVEVLVRCAPAFAGVYAGTLARGHVAPPADGRPLLVVCGSWVTATTRQLEVLVAAHPGTLVEVDADALAYDSASAVERAAREASALLERRGLAVVATSRTPPVHLDFGRAQRIAVALAGVVAAVEPEPAVVLAKGGVTSHVTAQVGLGARRGVAVGPLADGVALWRLETRRGREVPYVVFPGNVGGDRSLLEVVELLGG